MKSKDLSDFVLIFFGRFCFFLALFFLIFPRLTYAQRAADLEAWTGFQLRKDLPKGFAASVEWQSRFDDNVSRLKRNYLYVDADYKVKKYLSVLVQYRFSTNPFSDAHRFRTGLVLKTKYKKFSLANRIIYQQQYGYLTEEWIGAFGPSRALRNRLQLGYTLTKKIGLSVSAEPSWRVEPGTITLRRIRYMAALDFNLPKKFSAKLFYILQPDYNQADPALNYVCGLRFAYDLPGKKKSKDKKNAEEKTVPDTPKEKPPHNE